MSGGSNTRSKSAIKTKSQTEQIENSQNEKKDDEIESGLIEALTTTPTVIRRYKQPYRNFLRDIKIQMQNENLSNPDLVKIASERWKTMTIVEKQPYIQEAAYAKQIDAQNQKNNNSAATRQKPVKRKRKCPKCGGYPASSSPSASEQSTNETPTEAGTAATTESEDSDENNQDYSSDVSYYSNSTETNISEPRTADTDIAEHDASKKTPRLKKRTKKSRRNVKRRKQESSTSGSASYYANSSDNSLSSDTVIHSDVSNYTSASI